MGTLVQSTRRNFLKSVGAGAMGLAVAPYISSAEGENTLPGMSKSTKYPENSSSLTVADPSKIKVLQCTDIHFFSKRNEAKPVTNDRTLELMKRLVDHAQPDLLVLTGDTWHNNPEGKGKEFQEYAITKIGELGIPTAYTWGNHDQLDDYVAGHDKFAEAPHSLYRGGSGCGNYSIDLITKSGEKVWELVCLNTNENGIQPAQWEWMDEFKARETASGEKQVPIHCFMHIPLLQYYYIWFSGLASGLKLEEVCSEHENGLSILKFKDLGMVKAIFCGHDHVNDYTGMAEGIELVYGRSTGFGGYGEDVVRKGGKLITINAQAGTYSWESIFVDGTVWYPEKKQIKEPVDTPWMRFKEIL